MNLSDKAECASIDWRCSREKSNSERFSKGVAGSTAFPPLLEGFAREIKPDFDSSVSDDALGPR